MFRLVSLFYEVVPGVLLKQGKVGAHPCTRKCQSQGPPPTLVYLFAALAPE
jgi:hypothetical protein